MTLNEISLCDVAIEGNSFATSVKPQHVKSVNGVWVPAVAAAEYKSIVDERSNLEWFRDQLQAREDALADLDYRVARMHLGMRSRR
jgi:hypothetical protein